MEMSLPNDYVSFNVETTPRTSWGVTDRNLEYAVVKQHRKPGYVHRTSDNVLQKIELCPTKAASQRTRLSCLKLKKNLRY